MLGLAEKRLVTERLAQVRPVVLHIRARLGSGGSRLLDQVQVSVDRRRRGAKALIAIVGDELVHAQAGVPHQLGHDVVIQALGAPVAHHGVKVGAQ